MTTWKKTKKRRAQKAQEQKQAAASAAAYEEDLRARQAAEEASWQRHREMIEACRAADLAARVEKADEALKAETPSPSPRPAPQLRRRPLYLMSMLLAPLLLGAAGMDSLAEPPPKEKP